MSLSQNSPFAKEPTSMRRTAILLVVDVPDDLSDAVVHDAVLRNQKYLFEGMELDGVPVECVAVDVSEDFQLQGGAVEARQAHNLEVPCATQGPATNLEAPSPATRRTDEGAGCETAPVETRAPRFFMWRVCCVCKLNFGMTACGPENHKKATHGLCPACEIAEKEKLALLRKKKFRDVTDTKADLIPVNG